MHRTGGHATHSIVQTVPKRGYRLVTESIAAVPTGPLNRFEQNIGFAATDDGARIAYATSGAGPTLLRVPHWMTHLEWDWRSLVYGQWIKGLWQRFRLVRYDGRREQHLDALCQLVTEGWAQDNAAFRQIMTSQMFPAPVARIGGHVVCCKWGW